MSEWRASFEAAIAITRTKIGTVQVIPLGIAARPDSQFPGRRPRHETKTDSTFAIRPESAEARFGGAGPEALGKMRRYPSSPIRRRLKPWRETSPDSTPRPSEATRSGGFDLRATKADSPLLAGLSIYLLGAC